MTKYRLPHTKYHDNSHQAAYYIPRMLRGFAHNTRDQVFLYNKQWLESFLWRGRANSRYNGNGSLALSNLKLHGVTEMLQYR